MVSRYLAVGLLALLLLGTVVHMAVYYPRLPDNVASQINAAGQAADRMPKGAFMAVYACTCFGVAGMMTLIALLIPILPVSWVNLPRKEYWLAPQRRQETLGYLSRSMLWFSDATLGFLIGCMHLVFRANLRPQQEMGSAFWMVFSVYAAFVGVWWIALLWRFRVPARARNRA